jgi:signal transduction histidine kinase
MRSPRRLYRERISVQLIASYVIVVLLTVLLIEVVLVAGIVILNESSQPVQGDDEIAIPAGLAEAAGVSAAVIGATAAGGDLAAGYERLAPERRAELSSVALGLTSSADEAGTDVPTEADLQLVIISDTSGTVVASSDEQWATPGQSISAVSPRAAGLADQVLTRFVELNGQPGKDDIVWFMDVADQDTFVAHPIVADGQIAGVVTLASPNPPVESLAPMSSSGTTLGLWEVLAANAAALIVVVIPALLVAIPVGIRRGRRLSQRVSVLAEAAGAMAQGDLSQRVEVRGEDEISRLSERFNDMVERLDTTDRARKTFVANVSHELRTPVAIIQGNLERMLDEPERVSADERRALEVIHQETITLSRLIDDLFTLARIEETALPLEALPLQVAEVAGQAVESIRAVAWEQRKVAVESLVGEGLPAVVADRTRLRQILTNLLYNALRYTPEGGMIVVDASLCAEMVEISVSDTGIGIPPEELERVFDRFHRVERGGRHDGGSGLGLHIVRQLVVAQGGTIVVTSESDQGTMFRFTLPVGPR